MLNVLLVTTWDTPCGIAEHSAYLKAAVERADPGIHVTPWDRLHPEQLRSAPIVEGDSIWLNYHAALHSQWTPDAITAYRRAGFRVGVTYHDTGVPNSDQCKGVCAAADAFVVHEPYTDLEGNGRYWRQGTPGWSGFFVHDWSLLHGKTPAPTAQWPQTEGRPVVGTVGFPFPWKNYDLLCAASAQAGWFTLLLAPGATDEQVARWRSLNPWSLVRRDFVPRGEVVAHLAGCDATAFLYSCANTGTSGAIRQGLAARKPLLALSGCRQFRDLEGDRSGIPGCTEGSYINREHAIIWVYDGSPAGVARKLAQVPIARVDPGIVALAERDSWASLGARYARLYHELAGA